MSPVYRQSAPYLDDENFLESENGIHDKIVHRIFSRRQDCPGEFQLSSGIGYGRGGQRRAPDYGFSQGPIGLAMFWSCYVRPRYV